MFGFDFVWFGGSKRGMLVDSFFREFKFWVVKVSVFLLDDIERIGGSNSFEGEGISVV